tara:strand:- start:4189 stop:4638 length:450 start_codon:yes stop_codon:yes gene_type:complete
MKDNIKALVANDKRIFDLEHQVKQRGLAIALAQEWIAEKDKRIAELEKYNLDLANESCAKSERIAELEQAQPKWISVDDELPKEDSLVVAAHMYKFGTCPDVACCNFYSGKFSIADDGLDASNYDGGAVIKIDFVITHWTPLLRTPEVK